MINLSFLLNDSKFVGKPVMIMGLARSGIAALRALQLQDIEIFVFDDDPNTRKAAEELGAIWVDNIEDFDFSALAFLLLAPGVPLYAPKPHRICELANKVNCPIISDIELFGLAKKNNSIIVGITGTNGKSTTTALCEHVLRELGKDAICCGNIGVPVLAVNDNQNTIYILEISSFQLDLCPSFRPDISVVLNITPDHLDRHGSIQRYIEAKATMFDGCNTAIIVSNDKYSKKLLKLVVAQNTILTTQKELPIPTEGLPQLAGSHNAQNITAVYHICKTIIPDMKDSDFRAALENFTGLPHRQEIITSNQQLLFINDSKATNADASAVALDTYKNIYWIAGGIAKAPEEFDKLINKYKANIKHAFLIGAAAKDLEYYLKKHKVGFTQCEILENATIKAVKTAKQDGLDGATILFSPACASFDQFQNFEKRGDAFRDIVKKLTQRISA